MQALSISQITQYLSDLVASDELLNDVWVVGEVSGYRPQTNSRYRYFQLKDDAAVDLLRHLSSAEQPASADRGMTIEAHGRVDVYAPRGTYSLIIDRFQPVNNRGALLEQLERLKARLAAEGLFDPARKRPLPTFPLRVGVVTSPDTAAFQDVRNVFARRFPLAHLIVSPTSVQGTEARAQIVRAIQRFHRVPVDVVLVCRGGGSVEDLWCFNDEQVVRAVAACPVPIITGVGHEIDTTLVDYAADVRAPTPSAAAELLTPDVQQLRQDVETLRQALDEAAQRTFRDAARGGARAGEDAPAACSTARDRRAAPPHRRDHSSDGARCSNAPAAAARTVEGSTRAAAGQRSNGHAATRLRHRHQRSRRDRPPRC
jgi:exodeoxyribonuclease VII large subunit